MVSARLRRIGVPELLDQPVGGDHLPTANQQQGQEQANPSSAQVEERPLPDHLEGPQDAEFHRCLPVSLVLPRQGWPRDQSAIGPRSQPRTIGGDHSHHTSRKETSMAHPDSATTGTQQHEHRALEGMEELYVREADRLEAINGPFGEAMLDVARLQPSERVLDVGCGQGTITLRAAQGVAPDGTAVGVDISAPLVALARQRAAAAGVGNVAFIHADAQAHPFQEHGFDAVISRFGTMFFQDPEAAFANLGRAIRQGGRLAIVCPNDPLKTEWVAVAFAAAAPHVGIPDLGPPGAPGPFASPTATDCGGFSRPAASTRSRSRP
jgi:SAM-dependent methyltransferase